MKGRKRIQKLTVVKQKDHNSLPEPLSACFLFDLAFYLHTRTAFDFQTILYQGGDPGKPASHAMEAPWRGPNGFKELGPIFPSRVWTPYFSSLDVTLSRTMFILSSVDGDAKTCLRTLSLGRGSMTQNLMAHGKMDGDGKVAQRESLSPTSCFCIVCVPVVREVHWDWVVMAILSGQSKLELFSK